ncbi:tRNA (adenosine(37)-N6)-threonylcarbamoyltransferase complex dimerization subunit type 1 TsaB [Sphingomonas sp. BIUV-7]|uniref:tRNA (Adenosine(37)-N6)-threonylcarbamoyltransferase complex dimerization subunit type 1 TsaB n=1 Tax=Sphingomonas natans TaxID=3063330 RepID=A0ABT8YEH2_9SPHN|nr:tRNA (adenosine(37)-N6)-threonylcarbamoyltransferase complex dimerization subunit type 1 TsaB [Sphingomonas sp. BIUV-7]MDO6416748.1 tRNA (adenosine(37)-N6)-threonylcarbamoyltransferase complex dimerization subunit type 1 TsaB [Sphingomonas sp. BIUV-7]
MRTLVIETATAACSAALVADSVVLAAAHEVVGRGHAERLVPMIQELIGAGGLPDAVLVDCGPGSFTGIRVGLAAARAFGLGWSVPVTGYSSLALLAAMAGASESIAVAIPGGHGELFVQSFASSPLRAVSALRSLKPEDAAAAIPEAVVVGPGARALVEARGWGEVRDILPDARAAVALPAELVGLPPVPIYGRAPDAKLPA